MPKNAFRNRKTLIKMPNIQNCVPTLKYVQTQICGLQLYVPENIGCASHLNMPNTKLWSQHILSPKYCVPNILGPTNIWACNISFLNIVGLKYIVCPQICGCHPL